MQQKNQKYNLCILLPCQNLTPTLPTMHVDLQQFDLKFGCVMLEMANVAEPFRESFFSVKGSVM